MNTNIYLYFINLEKPVNFLALFEDTKTANEFFEIEELILSENINDK